MLPAEAYVLTSINPWWLDNDKSSAAWHTFAVPTFISTNAALEMWRHIMFNPTGRYMVYWVLTPVAPWFLSLKRNPRELTWSHTPLLLLIFKDPFFGGSQFSGFFLLEASPEYPHVSLTSWHRHGRYVERLKEEIFHLAVKNRAFERLNVFFVFFFSTFREKTGKNTSSLTKVTFFCDEKFVFSGPRGIENDENYRCLLYGRNWFWYVTTSLGANKTSQKKKQLETKYQNIKQSQNINHPTTLVSYHKSRFATKCLTHLQLVCHMCHVLFLEKVWSWGSKVAWIWSLFGSSSDLDRIELWVTSKGIIYKAFVIIQNAPYP